jgi:hypothetical protein
MSPDEFSRWIKELRYDYELRLPDKEILQHWLKQIRHIPGESLQWIRDRIVAQNDKSFPKRFPDLVNSLWREWLHGNPDKRAHEETCPECDGGWVTIMEAEEMYPGTLIPVAYACNRCRQQVRGVKKLTKSEARRQGLTLVDAQAPFGEQWTGDYNVKAAAGRVSDRWPEGREAA